MTLICLTLAAPERPQLPVRPGTAVVLDGKVEEAEWRDAFSISRDTDKGKVGFYLKRNGPWLALALTGEGVYRGEILRVHTTDAHGAWFTSLLFGVGQPTLPPLIWRRGGPDALRDSERGPPPECPRAARLRVDVGGREHWAAEYLVRLSALGIGRDDRRSWRARIALFRPESEGKTLFVLPAGSTDAFDLAGYADLVTPDGWGAAERWAPVSTEVSREFDDHEFLHRLFVEHDRISPRDRPDLRLIESAVRPRSMARIGILRQRLEQGRARNPTLPSWTYFLGRLLNEGNLYVDALRLIESIPEPLRELGPFAGLATDHYMDTMEFEKALAVCRAHPHAPGIRENVEIGLERRREWALEKAALEKDAAKEQRQPRVKLVTEKGDIVCELFEDDAPHAVRNFMDLILRQNYYDGLRFRVAGGEVAQIGDPRTRTGADGDADGPKWRLRVDKSPRPFLRGYLATVPTKDGPPHGSQFAIALSAAVKRGGRSTAVFGRVVEGRDVLESLDQDDRLERIEVLFKRDHTYDGTDSREPR